MRQHKTGPATFTAFDVTLLIVAAVIALVAVAGMASAAPLKSGSDAMTKVPSELWTFRGATIEWRRTGGFRAELIEVGQGDLVSPASRTDHGSQSATASGTIFRGWQIGRRLVGRAEMTVPGCPQPFRYTVRGWLSPAGERAVLAGAVPVVVGCQAVSFDPFGAGSTLVLDRVAAADPQNR